MLDKYDGLNAAPLALPVPQQSSSAGGDPDAAILQILAQLKG